MSINKAFVLLSLLMNEYLDYVPQKESPNSINVLESPIFNA